MASMRTNSFLLITLIVGVGFETGCSSNMEIKPGIGLGKLIIGKTALTPTLRSEQVRKKYEADGIGYYSADSIVLSSLVVHGRQYRTAQGIGVGSTGQEVQGAFGPGARRESHLMAGGTILGKFADYALQYSGIAFLIVEDHVVAVIIVKK